MPSCGQSCCRNNNNNNSKSDNRSAWCQRRWVECRQCRTISNWIDTLVPQSINEVEERPKARLLIAVGMVISLFGIITQTAVYCFSIIRYDHPILQFMFLAVWSIISPIALRYTNSVSITGFVQSLGGMVDSLTLLHLRT
jgi:hypothetical protein